MPRIDPLQLLKCLSVLLSPEGGIMSREEVPRLVNLMTKFSKKLVSKCVYLLILKSTDDTLVDMFMASGGWLLIHTWLQEAMASSNWNLVQEILELLLVTPVDSSRLRLNNIPKLVKTLSKREDLGDVKEMAASLVNNWLAIVKNATAVIQDSEKQFEKFSETPVTIEDVKEVDSEPPKVTNEIETVELPEAPVVEDVTAKMEVEDEDNTSTGMVYKITVRDGKQVITKLANSEESDEKNVIDESDTSDKVLDKKDETKEIKEIKPIESKSKSSSSKSKSSSSSKKSSSSSSSRSSSSGSNKDKDKKHSSRHSSKNSSSSSIKEKDKEKNRKDKENEKDKHRNNGSVKHSSGSSSNKSTSSSSIREKDKKDSKEKQADKDKDTLAKLKPVTLDKIGRIPKKIISSDEKNNEVKKKPSMSIEPKKKAEDRPKTVKIFNSKMRSTGLEEEVKPPPPRNAVKKLTPVIPPVLPLPTKRLSPPRDPPSTPPEKKLKIELPERAGAIKLIPPKPKPPVLLESDIFMDALTAATSKKEPKKRKRRASVSKESPENSPSVQPPAANSPLGLKNFTPANFYQDTLETTDEIEETREEKTDQSNEEKTEENKIEGKEERTNSDEVSEISDSVTRTNSDGLKGVLVYLKRKGPKRSVRWKEEKDLVDIKYFELDETERVNVSRTNFTDMAKLEMTNEREALLGRKLMNEDLMEPTTLWRIPYLVDQSELPVQPGCKSLEKDIQYAREKNILQALYFNKNLIPDTPAEPILETHAMVDPVIIPLEDAESQVYDLRNTPWPEPKGMPPVEEPPVNMPPMFPNIPGPFPNFSPMGLPPQAFPGLQGSGFCPPNMLPNGPPNMMHNGNMNMMGNPNINMGAPMEMMNQAPINPNMFVPGGPNIDNFNPMMNENPNFPMPYNQPNMYGPPNNNFNNMDRGSGHRGRGGFRRGHNNNNWGRNHPRGGNNWRNNRDDHRGGTGRICKNVKNHGYCRNIETCPFVHPN